MAAAHRSKDVPGPAGTSDRRQVSSVPQEPVSGVDACDGSMTCPCADCQATVRKLVKRGRRPKVMDRPWEAR